MAVGVKETTRLEERFRLWDSDGNGVIERSDFEAEADGILSRLGAHGTARGAELRQAYLDMFDRLAAAAGSTRLTREAFLQIADQEIVSKGDAGFASMVRPAIQAIVNVLDVDGDGAVSPAEMAKWFDAMGLAPQVAGRAFADLDANGDGKLSVTELVDAVRDYHLGKHDIPLLG
ncbi:EF-hand domain-containing protein [Microtetraspora malaysiensis]|uniref:EF-hand domain-containing protein n=1 Tax=Microtetraspora malaysiensis TaxID=161358 RepID=UPI003D912401